MVLERIALLYPFTRRQDGADSRRAIKTAYWVLYIATEIVASGFGVGEAGAQRPEHTHQYVRSASTARPRLGVA